MILAGDVGGTHARFALYDTDGRVAEPVVLETRAYRSDVEVFEAALASLGTPLLERGCIAVAGPVVAGRAHLTNVNLSFSQTHFAPYAAHGIKLVKLSPIHIP